MQKKIRWGEGGEREREKEISVGMESRKVNRFELHKFQDLILSPDISMES